MNDINAIIQNLAQAKQAGKNPKAIMQMMMQQNPNVQQQMQVIRNMANGRNPREFFTDLARQHGANEQSIEYLNGFFQ